MRKGKKRDFRPGGTQAGTREGKLKADARQMHITIREKMGGVGTIGFLCDVLGNESIPDDERNEAADWSC
jgi:hypothetical protein